MSSSVSIVVPALNEADRIGASLARLRRDFPTCELVLVDGGSTDGTAEIAARTGRVLHSARGRAVQMNTGAAHTQGDVLWFVHADTVLEPAALGQLHRALDDPSVVGGGLSLRFDRVTPGLNLLARSSNVRARLLHQVFGDQAMFLRRSVFDQVGGFAPWPLMEDLDLSRRLRSRGRLVLLPATSTASARRFAEHGTGQMVVFMQYLKLLHLAGVPPQRLALLYQRGPRLPRLLPPVPGGR